MEKYHLGTRIASSQGVSVIEVPAPGLENGEIS
jgi:hypothetical protein